MGIYLGNSKNPTDSTKDILMVGNSTQGEMPPSAFRDFSDKRKYEPQRDNHFEFVVEFDGNDKLLRYGESIDSENGSSTDAYFGDVQHILRVSLDSAFLPEIGVGTIPVKRGNSDIVFAGAPNIGHSGTLNFNDWIGVRTYDILLAWFQLVYNMTTDKVGLAQDYKRTAHIFQYTPTWQLVRAWQLNGVFPTGVKGGDLSYSNGGNAQMKVQATISYDNFELDYRTLDATLARAEGELQGLNR